MVIISKILLKKQAVRLITLVSFECALLRSNGQYSARVNMVGVLTVALFMRLGVYGADAYTLMVSFWLMVAYLSAFSICRLFRLGTKTSALAALVWLSMPVVWVHAGYSMLSLGIALLSFYFLSALRLFLITPGEHRVFPFDAVLYFVATFVAVFMDGYSFMMFAIGTSTAFLFVIITRADTRKFLLRVALPIHLASFWIAYIAYTAYIGVGSYDPHPISSFRGWGMDLMYFLVPSKGIHWLPDLLGVSQARSSLIHFGDSSVWNTTFAFPMAMLGGVAWWLVRKELPVASGVLIVAVLGLYLALGPSLKIDSTKPESMQTSQARKLTAVMQPEFALAPTGSALISTIPGFSSMRASYRWSALGVFSLWLLIIMGVSRSGPKARTIWVLLLLLSLLIYTPNLVDRTRSAVDNRMMAVQIDRELMTPLRAHLTPKDVVAFVPYGNDLMINYLASAIGFRAFNIGGDKNLEKAKKAWPAAMLHLKGELRLDGVPSILALLYSGAADVIVIPYFHPSVSAFVWPCPMEAKAVLDQGFIERSKSNPKYDCSAQRKEQRSPVLNALRVYPYLDVTDLDLFATIKLRPEFRGRAERDAIRDQSFSSIRYPIRFEPNVEGALMILNNGWHSIEPQHVWSQAKSSLALPVPDDCNINVCEAVLKYRVFGSSLKRPQLVLFDVTNGGRAWHKQVTLTSDEVHELSIPLVGDKITTIEIEVPDAVTPRSLGASQDSRILGVALQRIDLTVK